ncbi:MAG: short-chain dehydrogenase, partial [Rhizobium sp.]
FGRLVDPAEVARAVAFLSSGESGLMTGATINLDQSIWGAYEGTPHPQQAM